MKRLLLLCLMTAAPISADGLVDTWKELGTYRTVSALKALITADLLACSAHSASEDFKALGNAISDKRELSDKLKELNYFGAKAFGMAYVSYLLLWDHLRPYAKHALAIK